MKRQEDGRTLASSSLLCAKLNELHPERVAKDLLCTVEEIGKVLPSSILENCAAC